MSSIVVQKGSGFNGGYSGVTIPTATDWTGTVSVYKDYPGTATLTKPLAQSPDLSKLLFSFDAADILGLDAGVYTLVGNIVSDSLEENSYRIDYMTVTEMLISDQPMTTITMTIGKMDGTPTGTATKTLNNYRPPSYQDENGVTVISLPTVTIVNGWKGITVTARVEDAFNIGTDIIGVESISTETNAAGYAELSVIKGSTVTVACTAFGKAVTVDTTGLDTVDLSTYF